MASVYLRKSDNRWCAAATLTTHPRRRAVFTSSTREGAEAKLTAALAAGAVLPDVIPDGQTRQQRNMAARERGSHTYAEMVALRRSHSRVCHYCDVRLDAFNSVLDHKVPVSRGGSDAISNLDLICWECNTGKWANPVFTYLGVRPRVYIPMPSRREDWNGLQDAAARLRKRGSLFS